MLADPSSHLLPAGAQPPVGGGTAVVQELATVQLDRAANEARVRAHGPAGLPFLVLVAPAVPLHHSPFGPTALDPAHVAVWSVAVFPDDRRHDKVAPLPPLPPGLLFALQPLVLLPTGPGLGVPSLIATP